MATHDVDVDAIESLLQELEGGVDGGRCRSKNAEPKIEPSAQQHGSASPSIIQFSTYSTAGNSTPAPAFDTSSSGQTSSGGPRVLGKLTPLKSVAAGSPGSGACVTPTPVVWSQYKQTVTGSTPSDVVLPSKESVAAMVERRRLNSRSGGGRRQEDGTRAADMEEDTSANCVNFLPITHARFLRELGGITPLARWGHSLTAVGGANGQLMMFGGTTSCSGEATNDLFTFTPAVAGGAAMWEPSLAVRDSAAAEARPEPRYYHAAAMYESRYLVVMGGRTSHGSASIGDLWAYDTVSQRWAQWWSSKQSSNAQHRDAPAAIYGHTVTEYLGCLYIAGGKVRRAAASDDSGAKEASKETVSNDVFVFHMATRQWRKRISGKKCAAAMDEEAQDVVVPAKRVHHAACLHQGSLLIVHGGEGADGQLLSDTWALDLHSKTWTCLHRGNTADAVPRSHHCLFSCGEGVLCGFGGSSRNAVGGLHRGGVATAQMSVLPILTVLPVTVGHDVNNVPVPLCTGQWSVVVVGNSSSALATKRDFGAAIAAGFLYVFGGSSGAESATNQLLRCLVLDGVPHQETADLKGRLRTLILSGGAASSKAATVVAGWRWDCDIGLTVGSSTLYAHRAWLHQRAPKFLADVLTCRFTESEISTTMTVEEQQQMLGGTLTALPSGPSTGHFFRPPIFTLDGNSRVKGLDAALTVEQLESFLEFLYTGNVAQSEDATLVSALRRAAAAYEVSELTAALSDPAYSAATALVADMGQLAESSAFANATVLFVDPHTGHEVSHAAHTWVLAASCDFFCRLLRPLWTEQGKTQSQLDGVTARVTNSKCLVPPASQGPAGSRRTIVIGPVKIPSLSVRAVLRYLYTATLEVAPEYALQTLMAAHALGLDTLRAHCESLVARQEVSFSTCCDFFTLARQYRAPMLEELSLLTAAAGYDDVKKCHSFQLLEVDQRALIERIASDIVSSATGQRVMHQQNQQLPSPPKTEQKPSEYYASRMNAVSALHH